MKYIITGGAGFIGSHLAEKLVSRNETVIVVDDLSTGSSDNLACLKMNPLFKLVIGDAGSNHFWDATLQKGDIIIHLAATVGVKKVCENPQYTLENNARLTEKLLKHARRCNNKLFLASTSEIYGDSNRPVSREDDPVSISLKNQGRNAYIIGKLMSEQYCINYHQQYGLPVVVGRLFNAIGPRQVSAHGMVVPSFLKQALKGEPITVYGNGTQTRSFCHVSDTTDAILTLIENDYCTGHLFNIGAAEPVTIAALAAFIQQATGSGSKIINIPLPPERQAGSDIHFRRPCLDKIRSMTGWMPKKHWKESLKELIDCYTQLKPAVHEELIYR